MDRGIIKRYLLYLGRWQLSTPSLAIVIIWIGHMGQWFATIIANLIGGLIFFWVDKFIFTSRYLAPQWEVKSRIKCVDCNRFARGYRLVKTRNYDKTEDIKPEFRCEECSIKKTDKLISKGIKI